MNNVFSTIYETWFGIYNPYFQEIFSALYYEGGYVKFGLAFICITLVFLLTFYYLWKYPYGRFWHWGLWLLVTAIVVFGSTWGIANAAIFASSSQALNQALSNPASGYEQFASTLPIKYSSVNALLTIILGFLYSLIMKQFSKIQMHLPF